MRKKLKKCQLGGEPLSFQQWLEQNPHFNEMPDQAPTAYNGYISDFEANKSLSNVNSTVKPVDRWKTVDESKNKLNPDFLNADPTIDLNGVVNKGSIVPIGTMTTFKDANGKEVPYQQVIPDALEQGFNFDSDGVYRKNVITENKNKQVFSKGFQGLNIGLDLLNAIGDKFNDVNQDRRFNRKMDKARYMKSQYNDYEQGINNVPVMFQVGGVVNNTGYLDGAPTANNPVNIIPSGKITMKGVSKPVMAFPEGGTPVMMMPGMDYNFPNSSYTVETKMQNGGRRPIITSNPNDSRLKAYNDSLSALKRGLHNMYSEYNVDPYKKLEFKRIGYVPYKDINVDIKGNRQGTISYEDNNEHFYNTKEKAYPGKIKPIGFNMHTPTKEYSGKSYNNPYDIIYSSVYKAPVQPVVYQKPVQSIKGSENPYLNKSEYNKKYPPIYLTNPKDPRIGQYAEKGNQYLYKKPEIGTIVKRDPKGFMPEFNQPDIQTPGAPTANMIPTMKKAAPQEKTNWSYTYPTGDYNGQKTVYFPSADAFMNFTDKNGYMSRNISGDKSTGYAVGTKYQVGGMPEVEGVDEDQANAELEQGEVFEDQQGGIQKVAESEPRHEDGGSNQPNVNRVLEDTSDKRKDSASKVLKITPDEAEKLTGFRPKFSVSHSKLYEQASEFHQKKLKGIEKKIDKNLDYVKDSDGGQYAKRSLDLNLKFMQTMTTPSKLFDALYNHQEEVKAKYNIQPEEENRYGGVSKFQVGGLGSSAGKTNSKYPNQWKNYNDVTNHNNYQAPDWITPTEFYGIPGLVDYMKTLDKLPGVADNDLGIADDGVWGYRHKLALDHYGLTKDNWKTKIGTTTTPNITPTVTSPTIPTVNTTAPTVEDKSADNTKYTLPAENKPSQVNVGLGWSGGLGNVLGYLDTGRTPVDFEQLNRDYYKVHEEDATPVINANLGDYNAALKMLPSNGVGYANQANLLATKYKADNQAIGQVEGRNKAKYDARDADVEAKKFQLDQTNLALRQQAQERQLLGKEKQRQQKFEYLNGIFKAIDDRNAFDYNANLALQLTPFFDAKGQFNGNKYTLALSQRNDDGGRTEYIKDKNSGEQFRVIYDKDNKLISSTKLITDDRRVGAKK